MANDIVQDLAPILDTPVRMMFLFFERDRFRPSPGRTDCGSKLLRGMLDTLPDNKIVEDMHNALRRDSRANSNTVLSTEHVQQIITNSHALELRDIAHPSSVPKEVFVQRFRSTSGRACGRKHRGVKHQLPKNWTRIMGQRTWSAISEETLKTAMAAWEWLQNGFQPQSLAPREGVEKLELALLSCVMEQDMLVQHVPTGRVQVCLGGAKWAVLTWPMHELPATVPGDSVCYKVSEQGPARFVHVTDLSLWRAIPYEPARIPGGIVLRQVGPPQPLLRARLANPRTLTYANLVLIAKVEGLVGRRDRRQHLLEALAASQGDNTFVQQVLEEDGRPHKKAAAKLAEDEVCEAALEGIDPDDRQEFAEVGEAVRRGRARRRGHAWAQRRQAPLRPGSTRGPRRKRRRTGDPPPPAGDLPPGGAAPGVGGAPVPPGAAEAPAGGAAPGVGGAPVLPGAADAPAGGAAPPAGGAAPGVDGAPAPPGAAEAPAGGAAPHDGAAPPVAALPRAPRGNDWPGRQKFPLAVVASGGLIKAWSARCNIHKHDGERCNKRLNMGEVFTSDEARRRIKEWCMRGVAIPDGPGGRAEHMRIQPRNFAPGEVRTEAALDLAARPA